MAPELNYIVQEG